MFAPHSFRPRRKLLGVNQLPRTSVFQRERIICVVISEAPLDIYALPNVVAFRRFTLQNRGATALRNSVSGADGIRIHDLPGHNRDALTNLKKLGGADGIRIHQRYGNKGVLRCNSAF